VDNNKIYFSLFGNRAKFFELTIMKNADRQISQSIYISEGLYMTEVSIVSGEWISSDERPENYVLVPDNQTEMLSLEIEALIFGSKEMSLMRTALVLGYGLGQSVDLSKGNLNTTKFEEEGSYTRMLL
jgi:hypothetical protein